jgi:hypothetical protein
MRLIYALTLLLLGLEIALADGGAVQFRATASPFAVTVFTDPPQCRAGQVDLSTLVQEETGPVLDAEVIASLSPLQSAKVNPTAGWVPPACANSANPDLQNIPLQISTGTNRLFYSALIQIPYDGRWQLLVRVRQGAKQVAVQGILEVERALPPITAYWQWFLLPLVAIGGFALNQHIRAQRPTRAHEDRF